MKILLDMLQKKPYEFETVKRLHRFWKHIPKLPDNLRGMSPRNYRMTMYADKPHIQKIVSLAYRHGHV
jgi:hypothetical protein